MRVYVAGSFKNAEMVREIGKMIRSCGYEAYVFCDTGERTYDLSQQFRTQYDLSTVTPNLVYQIPELYHIGIRNLDELTQCDALVLVLPCGRSAHLEAGWMVGRGRPVYAVGPMVKGEFDAMYVMMNGIFDIMQLDALMRTIARDEVLRREL